MARQKETWADIKEGLWEQKFLILTIILSGLAGAVIGLNVIYETFFSHMTHLGMWVHGALYLASGLVPLAIFAVGAATIYLKVENHIIEKKYKEFDEE